MDPLSIVLIAVALAMDAFSVSVCSGMTTEKADVPLAFKMAAFFGGFQVLMPLLGWAGGTGFSHLISGFDHWVAFGLLLLIGGRMLYESFKGGECPTIINPRKLGVLVMLAVATSIDALAVGLSFALLDTSITVPLIAIGVVAFGLSFLGVVMGKRLGGLLQNRAEIVGGLILIAIGTRILVDHLGLFSGGVLTWL